MVLPRNMFLMVCSFPCVAIEYRSRTTANSNVALLLEILLLTMKVFLMLQMNHRNALWRRRRFRPYWVLPRPAESWFKINFNCRIISENIFFIVNWNERNTFDRLLVILRPFLQREDTKKKLYQTRKFIQLEFIAYRTENHLKAPVLLWMLEKQKKLKHSWKSWMGCVN